METVQADAGALPMVDGTFAAAVSFTVIGLGGPGREVAILAELTRVVAPGGLVAVSVLRRVAGPRLEAAFAEAGIVVDEVVECGQDVGYVGRRLP